MKAQNYYVDPNGQLIRKKSVLERNRQLLGLVNSASSGGLRILIYVNFFVNVSIVFLAFLMLVDYIFKHDWFSLLFQLTLGMMLLSIFSTIAVGIAVWSLPSHKSRKTIRVDSFDPQ